MTEPGSPSRLAGKVAIVTGASRGIGLAISRALVLEGVSVAMCGRTAPLIERVAEDLTALGPGRALGFACDVASAEDSAAFVARTMEAFGRLDVLVNNAGIGIFAPVPDMDPADFRRVIETNVIGVFNMCHAGVPAMRRSGGGSIINISSLAGTNAFAGGAAYNASKFGLNGFSEALMHDVRYDGIRVSYVMPGSVSTEFAGNAPGAGADWKLAPEDVAEAVLDLLRFEPRALASRIELRPSQPRKS
ncbi:MAG: SDR family oxidoreductase [Blastocatellia bacterium]|nr:SDR family oxidoreductase [Blastocatellia bacterium]